MARRAVYAILALVGATGLVISFVSQMRSGDGTAGARVVRFFSYFTIESNILVLATAALLALGVEGGRREALLHLDALLGIAVTGIVFALVLAPDQDGIGLGSVLLHYIAPPLAVLAWLVLGPRRVGARGLVAPALAWPLAWLVWTLVHGAMSGWYPYDFVDVDVHGLPTVLRNAGLVLVLGLALLAAFVGLDRRRSRVGSAR